jgi:hypothetical protein
VIPKRKLNEVKSIVSIMPGENFQAAAQGRKTDEKYSKPPEVE